MRPAVPFVLAFGALAGAQTQPTFYAAWEDGREWERQEQWRPALGAYARAAALRPASASSVIIYGNNLLRNYYPYTRMAKCHLELGEIDAAEACLRKAEAHGEPLGERQELARRTAEAQAHARPVPAPAAPVVPVEAPKPKAPPSPIVEPPRLEWPEPQSQAPAAAPAPLPSPSAPRPAAVPGPEAQPARREPPPPPAGSGPAKAAAASPRAFPWAWALVGLGALAVLAGWRRRRAPQAPESGGSAPTQVGPYRLEGLLGHGGFASTYRARHEGSGRLVALKLLHPFRLDDAEFVDRFRQEARLGLRLNHPHLVKVVDPGPEEGMPWLAMEYLEGERLDRRLKGAGPLALPEALRLATQIAQAMAHAHAQGVVHRDLKPGNVLLVGGAVKVMDFGIARIVDAETLTTTYAFLGTPLYAAPEAQLKTAVGPAADRYALGVMIFELLAGAPPFQGETPFDILDRHRTQPLPDLAALRPDLPPALVDLVQRLCAKDPEARPDDGELLRILEGFGGVAGSFAPRA